MIVGGVPVASDGRVHTTFGHNPSSLRLCSFDPNLQNIPRGGDEWAKLVKDMFVASPGKVFWERDFSGIEAVLVGYFAGAPNYIRLAKMDVHSFYTAYGLNALDGRVATSDLPDLSWDDARLAKRLAEIKKEFKSDRNNLFKHLVHGANYLQSAHGAQEHIFKITSQAYDVKVIKKVMGVYFELFPEIRNWHDTLCARVDGTRKRSGDDGVAEHDGLGVCFVKNPFGYVHRFYHVLDWEKIDGRWFSSKGEDAKRLVSFLPQSTAAAIIKKAAKRLYNDYPNTGQSMRLLIHDSILGETDLDQLEQCLADSRSVMESPIVELPMDPAWGLGPYLTINSEAKSGLSWGAMD